MSGELGSTARSRASSPHFVRLSLVTLAIHALGLFGTAQGVPIEQVDTSLGRAVYSVNCAGCHQPTGTGIRSAIPPLAENVAALLSQAQGREYLVGVLLYGLDSPRDGDVEDHVGIMPSWHHLDDAQLAAVLNHVATAWGNADRLPSDMTAFGPLEVSLARRDVKSSAELLRMRPHLGQ